MEQEERLRAEIQAIIDDATVKELLLIKTVLDGMFSE